jgi:hypothetical protein
MACATPPTKTGFVASGYGPRPGRRTGETRFHAGLDFRASAGTAIISPVDGVVETKVYDDGRLETVLARRPAARAFGGYGNVLVVKYPGPVWMSFNHLSAFAPGTTPGMAVRRGQWLGSVGNTSNGRFRGMGAHLHIETRHAPTDGRQSPFPGAYGAENFDPIEWFQRNGVELQSRILKAEASCRSLSGFGAVAKQSDVPWKAIADQGPKAQPGTEYEPTRATNPPMSVIALTIGAGVAALGLASMLGRRSRVPLGAGSEGDGRTKHSMLVDDEIYSLLNRSYSRSKAENIFAQVRREDSVARRLISKRPRDCDAAYDHLERIYELFDKISHAKDDRVQKQYMRAVVKADDLAEMIDFVCRDPRL